MHDYRQFLDAWQTDANIFGDIEVFQVNIKYLIIMFAVAIFLISIFLTFISDEQL